MVYCVTMKLIKRLMNLIKESATTMLVEGLAAEVVDDCLVLALLYAQDNSH